MLNQKENYPITGAWWNNEDLKIKGINLNWKRFGNSLVQLAALLPSEE